MVPYIYYDRCVRLLLKYKKRLKNINIYLVTRVRNALFWTRVLGGRSEAELHQAEGLAKAIEVIGLADGQREHFANICLTIANSLLLTSDRITLVPVPYTYLYEYMVPYIYLRYLRVPYMVPYIYTYL